MNRTTTAASIVIVIAALAVVSFCFPQFCLGDTVVQNTHKENGFLKDQVVNLTTSIQETEDSRAADLKAHGVKIQSFVTAGQTQAKLLETERHKLLLQEENMTAMVQAQVDVALALHEISTTALKQESRELSLKLNEVIHLLSACEMSNANLQNTINEKSWKTFFFYWARYILVFIVLALLFSQMNFREQKDGSEDNGDDDGGDGRPNRKDPPAANGSLWAWLMASLKAILTCINNLWCKKTPTGGANCVPTHSAKKLDEDQSDDGESDEDQPVLKAKGLQKALKSPRARPMPIKHEIEARTNETRKHEIEARAPSTRAPPRQGRSEEDQARNKSLAQHTKRPGM
jgi:hypothetical protein